MQLSRGATMAKERSELERALDKVLATDEGVKVFQHLHTLSGYNAPFYDRNDQNNTTYNLGKRDLWLDLRRHLTREQLSLIELPKE